MLSTEMRNPNTTHIDRMSTKEILKAMNDENYRVPRAVEQALEQVAPLVDHIAEKMAAGGRIFYVGAGTSGRLGVLDAAECPPTFGIEPGKFIAIIAGGTDALVTANAGCEDDEARGAADLATYMPDADDTVIGLSAAGGAKYVLGAMAAAKRAGSATASICCNPDTPMASLADYPVFADTGAEAITGSTRMKAGSAQKMLLNLISTAVMIKLGRVYENYMVRINTTNEKLRVRAAATVCALTSCTQEAACLALEKHGNVRAAVEALRGGDEKK